VGREREWDTGVQHGNVNLEYTLHGNEKSGKKELTTAQILKQAEW